MQRALARAQSSVAPVDRRAEGPLTLGEVDRSLHLEREPLPERAQDLRRRKDGEAGRDELDRERQAVESAADLVDGRERVVLQQDAARRGKLDEERGRVLDRERLEREHVLGREAERRAARREDLQVGRLIEQLGDWSGGCREVLEVVEEEQRAGPVQAVRNATRASLAPGLAHADRSRDRARHEVGVGDRRKADEVHGSLDRRSRSDLECEAALPGAARAGDGDEARRRSARRLSTRASGVGTPDESVMERRKARRGERLQRREVLAELGRDELEELCCGGNVLQSVVSERPERTPRGAARSPAMSRVARVTTICSPCAEAQSRAATTTSMPT